MLDSPRLTIPARRAAPVVDDVRPSEAVDDPIQRRDLVLLEQARDGSLDAFNSLVECYQDHLFALVARMVTLKLDPTGRGFSACARPERPR